MLARFFVWVSFFYASFAMAQISIDIPEAQSRAAQPIAILDFLGANQEEIDYIIASDLHKSGYFQPIAPDYFPNQPRTPSEINYDAFANIGANYILMGRVLSPTSVQFVLAQTGSQSVLLNEEVRAENERQAAHLISDRILQALTGKHGAFSSKIAYILEQNRGNQRRYALVVSDYDGANRQEIFSSNQPILSPAWSRDGQFIAYMTYANYYAQIVVQNVATGERRVVLQGDATSSAPTWSPDGRFLALSLSNQQGSMDIYLLNLVNGENRRLTQGDSINTEPEFSDDGRFIYFTSDRAGNPQIYRMNRQGGNVERVLSGANYGSNGALSPDNQHLALTRQSGGVNQIGIYNLQTGRFNVLTQGRLDEGASFAPNGEMLIYSTVDGERSVLKTVNLKGEVVQTLSDPSGSLRDPAWGISLQRKR